MDYKRDALQVIFGYVSWIKLEKDIGISKKSLNIGILRTENAIVLAQNS